MGVGELSLYHLSGALPVPLDWRSGTNEVWPRKIVKQSTSNAASLQRSGAQPLGYAIMIGIMGDIMVSTNMTVGRFPTTISHADRCDSPTARATGEPSI